MIQTKNVNTPLEMEHSYILECEFNNRIISIGTDTTLTNQAEVAVSNIYANDAGTKKLGNIRITVSGRLQAEANSEAYCDYKMVIEGVFSVSKEKSDEEFRKLLWYNGSSILYSIARAKLETITAMIFANGKISLPLVNMIDLVKQQSADVQKDKDQQD